MTAAEYDRVPQVVGADYESPVARSLERIWATKPGLWAGSRLSTTRRSGSATSSPPSPFSSPAVSRRSSCASSSRSQPGAADARAIRRAVLDARHHDDFPLRFAGALGLQQLSVSPGSGREGHGVSAPQRVLLLDLPRRGALHLRELAGGGRAQRRLVQLRSLRPA